MSLRIDSWKYPLETLDAGKPEVRAFGEWLARERPRMSRPSATALTDRLMTGAPVRPNDLQRILGKAAGGWQITAELLRLLNDVHAAYAPERAARAAYLRALNELRGQIPWAERERMRPIADRHQWLAEADAVIAKLGITGCESWLGMRFADRAAWFTRVEAFLAAEALRSARDSEAAWDRIKRDFDANYGPGWMRGDFRTADRSGAHLALGLSATASPKEVKAAFRRLAKEHHPDVGGDPAKFMDIQRAYERLTGVAS